jgi:uncharacterized protein (TIGR02569 family)
VVDGLVLKPGADAEETSWLAGVCARVELQGFRLAAPVPAIDGRLVVDGWSATTYLDGTHVDERDRSAAAWLPVLEAGRTFHGGVRRERRPAFLDARKDRYAVADRAAWSDAPPTLGPRSARLLDRLDRHVIDERLADQLVHGDLSGNVLLRDGLAPAVIDVSPYWRPATYADAIVVVDALLWWLTDAQLVDLGRPQGLDEPIWTSLLARALTFRLLLFDESSQPTSRDSDQELDLYGEVAELLASR